MYSKNAVTKAMFSALAEIERREVCGLPGRVGQALVDRGLAKAESSTITEHHLCHFGEGRWGRTRRDIIAWEYRLTDKGKKLLAETTRPYL